MKTSPPDRSSSVDLDHTAAPTAESNPSNRREVLKLGLAALPMAGAVSSTQGQMVGLSAPPPSPATTPFVVAMPIIPQLPARTLADAAFTRPPNINPDRAINPATGIPYEGRGDAHQLRSVNPPQTFFVQLFGAVPPVTIHPNLPAQVNFWGSNLGGANLNADRPMTPMPTIVSRYQAGANTAILVRRFNNLPTGAASGGFGKNSISTHLHNFHSAPDSDGGPCDPSLGALSENPLTQGRFFFPGQFYDYYYNMKRAGFNTAGTSADGDVRESLGTMWYHDHREAHTAENVCKGLAGFHILFNEYDTGNETTGFRLPSYPTYDIPIIFTDLQIDPVTLQATLDLTEDGGHLGDKYMVNGRIQPFFSVRKRRYRLRLLDMGPSRHYELFLVNPDNLAQTIPYWRISNDGNLYEKPLNVTSMQLAPAERADIIVDFAKLTAAGGAAAGATRLWLENRLVQTDPRKPETTLNPKGTPANVLVEFRIGTVAADNSSDPALITSFAPITLPPLAAPAVTRTFKFERSNGAWMVNGKFIDCNEIRYTMKRGRAERWILETGGGWAHPIHNHFVEGRIVSRNGVAVGPTSQEYVRKDVVALYPGDIVEYQVTALDYVGVYPMHCHNVLHEDYGMMLLFRVDDVGDTNPNP